MLSLLFNSPVYFLVFALSLVVAVTIHEFAHAWVADKLGDPTPRINDRLTLNPLAHLDPIGTLALLIVHVGWGKPVPIDPYNLKNPRRDAALISLAGPASNLILALLLSLLLKLPLPPSGQLILNSLAVFIYPLITLSVGLGIFNLLPFPPLDGAKILLGFLPQELADAYEETLNRYGIILLALLIFPLFGGRSLFNSLISPLISAIIDLLI